MGLLNFFSKPEDPRLTRLPSGSFTLDRDGQLVISTLPRAFPSSEVYEIGKHVLASFQAARDAQLPLTELIVHYNALKLMARELSGGAIIFLMPQSMDRSNQLNHGKHL